MIRKNSKTGISLPLILFLLLLNGCASTKTEVIAIDNSNLSALRERPELTAVQYNPNPFLLVTEKSEGPGNIGVLFGAIGGALGAATTVSAVRSAGAEIVNKYSLQDPIYSVKTSFIDQLATNQHFNNIKDVGVVLDDDSIAALTSKYPDSALFDFKTQSWGLYHLRYEHKNYYLALVSRGRIVDTKTGTVLWQGECKVPKEEPKNAPTLDQLEENNATLLKETLNESAKRCSGQLLGQLLGKK